MTRDDIIRMAREADPAGESGRLHTMAELTPETLERFAALVAAAEREECARVAEDDEYRVDGRGYYDQLGDARATAVNIAAAIRARK